MRAAVVGGGVVGLSVALLLAEEGAEVTVLEAGDVGGGASRAAHGQIVQPAPALQPLWRESLRFYDRLAADRDFEWDGEPVGALAVAVNALDVSALDAMADWRDGELLDRAALADVEPALGPAVVAALRMPEGRRTIPTHVVSAIAAAACEVGVRICAASPVEAVVPAAGGGWNALIDGAETTRFDVVVLAAGGATGLLAEPGGARIPLSGSRGRIVLTEPLPPLLSSIVSDARIGRRPDGSTRVALLAHQRRDGRVAIGASWTDARRPEPADLDARILAHAAERIPALAGARIETSWSGTRPCTPDGRPAIGPIGDGLYVCCGHAGDGFIAGPGSALLLIRMLLGRDPGIDPTFFHPARFTRQRGRE